MRTSSAPRTPLPMFVRSIPTLRARPPAVDLREAVREGAPQVWPEAPGNIAVDWPGLASDLEANAREVERVFASARHVARVSVVHQRIMVASMEPRGATASYDAAAE